jgi:hypothetical protein
VLRNDLITLLAQRNNDTVAVDVNGILIDVDAVTADRGNVVLTLNPEDLSDTVRQIASGRLPLQGADVATTHIDGTGPHP